MIDQYKLLIIAGLALVALIIIIILISNTKKSNLKKDIGDLNVRFNAVKTVPLAFKLSKAQAMAKRNNDTAEEVKVYYEKYEEAQRHIDQISDMLETIEDDVSSRKYRDAKSALKIALENIEDSEKEVADIDKFLEKFQEEENDQRDTSSRLKEQFRDLKLYVSQNSNNLSIAFDGIKKKIEKVEDLFSSSEEYMYINDYADSWDCLLKIKDSMVDIRDCVLKIPSLIKDTKGVIPALIDEANRKYALTRQRGVYTKHLNIDERLNEVSSSVSEDVKVLSEGNLGDVEANAISQKERLNTLLGELDYENKCYGEVKNIGDTITKSLNELASLHNYVSGAYKKDKERFGIENIDAYIKESEEHLAFLKADYIAFNEDLADNNMPSSELLKQGNTILEKAKLDIEKLSSYKASFDKNTSDEKRAKTQLMKLQVVLNEVEVKVLEYHLPTIANSYHDDLLASKQRIEKIKNLLAAIPINIEELNTTLDEAIDFIYKFYNNVNNIVGMAIMVENAIVFGNKYRSTYPEVERDLSKAEFSYLNGEYTKALTMAIACMEKLFPNKKDNGYLENA